MLLCFERFKFIFIDFVVSVLYNYTVLTLAINASCKCIALYIRHREKGNANILSRYNSRWKMLYLLVSPCIRQHCSMLLRVSFREIKFRKIRHHYIVSTHISSYRLYECSTTFTHRICTLRQAKRTGRANIASRILV